MVTHERASLCWSAPTLILFWLSSFTFAAAQTATDIELQAGYCLGVATAQLKEDNDSFRTATDAASKKLNKDVADIVAERQQRFRDYLAAKGFLDDRNPEPLKVAILRGVADVGKCGSDLKQDFFRQCGDRCLGRFGFSSEAYMQCSAKCPSPDACIRVKKCLENFLPF